MLSVFCKRLHARLLLGRHQVLTDLPDPARADPSPSASLEPLAGRGLPPLFLLISSTLQCTARVGPLLPDRLAEVHPLVNSGPVDPWSALSSMEHLNVVCMYLCRDS